MKEVLSYERHRRCLKCQKRLDWDTCRSCDIKYIQLEDHPFIGKPLRRGVSFTYFIKAVEPSVGANDALFLKIGKSNNPFRRMAEMSPYNCNGFELFDLICCPSDDAAYVVENHFRRMFCRTRVKGGYSYCGSTEWHAFNDSKEDRLHLRLSIRDVQSQLDGKFSDDMYYPSSLECAMRAMQVLGVAA